MTGSSTLRRLSNRWNARSAAASSPGASMPGVSNATPPARMLCSDSVATLDAVRPDRDVDAARVPEPARVAHQLVVRRVDEDREGEAAPVLVEGAAEHLADPEAAVVDRRALLDRAQVVGVQAEAAARHVRGHRRRLLQAGEAQGVLALARVEADVGARDQGAEAGHARGADARPDHPPAGALGHERLDLLPELGHGDDLLEVVAQPHVLDGADVDVLVAHLGLAGLEPLGGLEDDADRRPLLAQGGDGEPGRDGGGHQRHEPDDGEAAAAALDRGLLRAAARRDRRRRGRAGAKPELGRNLGHSRRPRSAAGRSWRRRAWSG